MVQTPQQTSRQHRPVAVERRLDRRQGPRDDRTGHRCRRGSRAALRRTRRERTRAPSCCSQDQGARICRDDDRRPAGHGASEAERQQRAEPPDWHRLTTVRDGRSGAHRAGIGRSYGRAQDAGGSGTGRPAGDPARRRLDQVQRRTIDPMVRFLVLYDTPPDPEEFDRHYREVHIPLTRSSKAFGGTRSAAMWLRFVAATPITL